MINDPLTSPGGLRNIGENGQPPATRLDNAREARELVEEFLRAGAERSRLDARYKGMFDGNPPLNQAKLHQNAEDWRTNVNPMEGKAARSAACVPYYDLFSGSQYYAEPKTYYGDEGQQSEWNQVMQEEFDCLLREDEDFDFDFNINTVIHDYVAYGKAFAMRPDDVSWHFEHIAQSRVKVRDRAKASLSKLDVLVILEDLGVNEVWAFIRNKASAEAVGWNIAPTTQAIRDAAPAGFRDSSTDYEAIQQQITDHDLSKEFSTPVIRLAHVYVKEFNDDITHLIINRDYLKYHEREQNERFLFKKQDRYERFNQAVDTFFLETQDGSWNGASGLGKDILNMIEIKARLFCKVTDNAFIRASVLLQPRSAAAAQRNKLVLGGGVTVLPPDFDVVNAQVFAEMEGVMLADRSIDEKLSNNTGIYKQKAEKPTGNPRTAEEVRLAYATQAILGNSAVNRFYKQLDRSFHETFRRAAAVQKGEGAAQKAAKAFQKRCTDRGVPIEALREIKSVRACRVVGNGSFIMKQQAFGRMLGMAGMLPEEGRAHLVRDAIVAEAQNQGSGNRYFPMKAITDLPDDHEALAVLENAAMRQGSPALVTGTQNHVIHATTHIRAVAQALTTLNQGADQEEILAFVDMVGPHISAHIGKLAQDPTRKAEVKGLGQQWQQLAALADKLRKKVEGDREEVARKRQEAMATQAKIDAINNGTDPAIQIEQAKAAVDLKIRGEKHAMTMANKKQAMELQALSARQDLAIKDAQAATDIRTKKAKASEPKSK